jgi:hypothetical protein
MDDTTLVEAISARGSSDLVHISDPKAYEAFRDGLILFDVSPDAAGLRAFVDQSTSEFGNAFNLQPDGSFRWFTEHGRRVYILSHRHAFPERICRSELMRELEREHPELFSN